MGYEMLNEKFRGFSLKKKRNQPSIGDNNICNKTVHYNSKHMIKNGPEISDIFLQ
jgi:hypothetical protein